MSFLGLSDNALFLKNWRERMRPASFGSATLVILIVTTLIFISSYLNPHREYDYASKTSYEPPWLCSAFFFLAVMQGVILLLSGTIAVYKMALLERTHGTIELHRASPSPRLKQVVGIILGGGVVEWLLFLGTLPISLLSGILGEVSLVTIFFFYCGLTLCALFFHSCAAFLAIGFNPKQNRYASIPFIAFFFFFGPLIYAFQLSFIYHLTWLPAYEYLTQNTLRLNLSEPSFKEPMVLLHYFFQEPFFFLLLQGIVQIPLIILLWLGLRRKISFLERSIFSKIQLIVLSLLTLFYYTGSAASLVAYQPPQTSWHMPKEITISCFLYCLLTLGILGATLATPSYLMFRKGLWRMKKLGLQRLGINDDYSTNVSWLVAICCASAFAFGIFSSFAEIPLETQIIPFLVIISQIIFFASAFEFFQLSPHHQKKIIFVTALIILWLLIPILGLITQPASGIGRNEYTQYFFALSPLFGPTALMMILTENTGVALNGLFIAFINILAALGGIYLSWIQRQKIVRAVHTQSTLTR